MRLLEGGTTLSLLPLTTRVGARIEPRNGMLDQFDTASDCHNRPRGSGNGQGMPSKERPKLRTMSALSPGVAPMPHEVEARINPRTRALYPSRRQSRIRSISSEKRSIKPKTLERLVPPLKTI